MHTIYIIIIIKPKQKQQRKGDRRRKKNEEEMHSFSRVKCDRETEKKTGVNNETKTLKKTTKRTCDVFNRTIFCRKGQFVRVKHTQRQHIRMRITVLFKYLSQKHTYTQKQHQQQQ
jgi:hypothetical protein